MHLTSIKTRFNGFRHKTESRIKAERIIDMRSNFLNIILTQRIFASLSLMYVLHFSRSQLIIIFFVQKFYHDT